jgi:membrane protease YdiL (CAAX protease family)
MTSTPPPAWYVDPGDRSRLRYWDGDRWTTWVSVRGQTQQAPITAEDAERVWRERTDLRAQWPGWVAAVALVAAVVAGAMATGAVAAGDALGLDSDVAELSLAMVGLYTGLLGTCWLVHRHLGTGQGFFADYGLAYQRGDWWRGLIGSFAARAGAIVMSLFALLWSEDFVGTDVDSTYEDEVVLTLSLVLLFAVVAVVLAPIIEELFFRGLLMRSLETVAPAWVALTVQAVVFGLAHVTVDLGAGNVGVVAAITAAGLALGIVARRFNRLAPAMFAHAWFNLLPTAAIVVLYLTD